MIDNRAVLSMLEQFYYTADVAYAEASAMMERWRELFDEIRACMRGPAHGLVMVDRLLHEGQYDAGLVALYRIIRHPSVYRPL